MYPYLSRKDKYQLCERVYPKFINTHKFRMSLIYKEYSKFLPYEPDKVGVEYYDAPYPYVDARDKYFKYKFFNLRTPRRKRNKSGKLKRDPIDEITDEDKVGGYLDESRDYGWDPLVKLGRPANIKMKFTANVGRPDRLKYNETSLSLKHRSFHTILTESAYMDSRLVILKPIHDEHKQVSYPHFGMKKLEGINFGVRHLFTFVLQKYHLENLKKNSINLIKPENIGFLTQFTLEEDYDIKNSTFKIRGFYNPLEVRTRLDLGDMRITKIAILSNFFESLVQDINSFHYQYSDFFDMRLKECDKTTLVETFSKLYHSGRKQFSQMTEEELEELKSKQSVKLQIKDLEKQLDAELESEPIEKVEKETVESIKETVESKKETVKTKKRKRKKKLSEVEELSEKAIAELLERQHGPFKKQEIESATVESKRIMAEFRKKELEEERNRTPFYLENVEYMENLSETSSDDLDSTMDVDHLNKLIGN